MLDKLQKDYRRENMRSGINKYWTYVKKFWTNGRSEKLKESHKMLKSRNELTGSKKKKMLRDHKNC